jgi:hypothetical protein
MLLGLAFLNSCSFSFREGAKIDIAQAQKILRHWQKKANFEDGLVTRLEAIRETLLNVILNVIYSKVSLFIAVHHCVHRFLFRCYTGG